jgi:hypothetical protein
VAPPIVSAQCIQSLCARHSGTKRARIRTMRRSAGWWSVVLGNRPFSGTTSRTGGQQGVFTGGRGSGGNCGGEGGDPAVLLRELQALGSVNRRFRSFRQWERQKLCCPTAEPETTQNPRVLRADILICPARSNVSDSAPGVYRSPGTDFPDQPSPVESTRWSNTGPCEIRPISD